MNPSRFLLLESFPCCSLITSLSTACSALVAFVLESCPEVLPDPWKPSSLRSWRAIKFLQAKVETLEVILCRATCLHLASCKDHSMAHVKQMGQFELSGIP